MSLQAKECQVLLAITKVRREAQTDSPSEPPEGTNLTNTLILDM